MLSQYCIGRCMPTLLTAVETTVLQLSILACLLHGMKKFSLCSSSSNLLLIDQRVNKEVKTKVSSLNIVALFLRRMYYYLLLIDQRVNKEVKTKVSSLTETYHLI
jgi:hypothetical protein